MNKLLLFSFMQQIAERLRLHLIEKAGGKCARCGFSDIRALVVHHPNNDRKENQITELRLMLLGKKEYEILCLNCHAIIKSERKIILSELKKILELTERLDRSMTQWLRRKWSELHQIIP